MEIVVLLFLVFSLGGAFIQFLVKRDLRNYKDELKRQMPYRRSTILPPPDMTATKMVAPDEAQAYINQWNQREQWAHTSNLDRLIAEEEEFNRGVLDVDLEDEENGE